MVMVDDLDTFLDSFSDGVEVAIAPPHPPRPVVIDVDTMPPIPQEKSSKILVPPLPQKMEKKNGNNSSDASDGVLRSECGSTMSSDTSSSGVALKPLSGVPDSASGDAANGPRHAIESTSSFESCGATEVLESEVVLSPPLVPSIIEEDDPLDEIEALSSPAGYAYLHLGQEQMHPWQMSVLDSMEPVGARTALRTCNESGKTSLVVASLILWHMGTFPNSQTVTTAGVYRQITQQLYPSLKSLSQRLPDVSDWEFGKDWGKAPNGSTLISFSASDPEHAEGYHEQQQLNNSTNSGNLLREYGVSDDDWQKVLECTEEEKTSLLIICDEAKSIDRGIFHAFERCHATRWLVTSSPGATDGYFYDCFNIAAKRWRRFHAAAYDCPHLWDDPVRRAEIEDQLATLPRSLTDSMVYGEFSAHADGACLVNEPAWVDKAMSGICPRWNTGQRRAAVDLSLGGDETVMYVRDGNEATLVNTWRESDDEKLVNEMIVCFQKWQLRPEWIYADNGGLGKPILNALKRKGWDLNRIDFGGKAKDERYYLNARADMYFSFANRLRAGEVRLPRDDKLKRQLTFQKYVPSDGPMKLVPKHKLPESPDRADTIVMLYWEMPAATEYAERQLQLDIAASKTMVRPDGEWVQNDEGESSTGLWDV